MPQNALVLGDTSNEKGAYVCPDLAWIEKQLIDLKDKKQVFLFLHVCAKDWSLHGTECRDFEQMLLTSKRAKINPPFSTGILAAIGAWVIAAFGW
ncbi:MAG: hypothetical protein EAZ32_17110 [Cytophagia bacterium]|nr:MAG: hypothetical protein EAZ32_17110 [Cytophagia bacterium]